MPCGVYNIPYVQNMTCHSSRVGVINGVKSALRFLQSARTDKKIVVSQRHMFKSLRCLVKNKRKKVLIKNQRYCEKNEVFYGSQGGLS